MNYEKFIATAYINRLSRVNDPLAVVVTIHLYTEYWLDRILESACENPNRLPRQMNYKNKLDIVHSLVSLPDGLHKNLSKLNTLRNKCAHNLDFDFSTADYNYDLSTLVNNNEQIIDDLTKIELWDRLMWIGIATFGWVNNFANKSLGLKNNI